MRLVSLTEIRAALDEARALAAVAQSFIDFSQGRAQNMAVGYLCFDESDCHVKGAGMEGSEFFAIKIATDARSNGQTQSHGMVGLFHTGTGEMLALLRDEGMLTALRTAMAGAIAARAIAPANAKTLGVVGSGKQAQLQADMVARVLGLPNVLISARNAGKAQAIAQAVGAQAVPLDELCRRADIIITTTIATQPVLTAAMVREGARIVALGADAPGKRELDAALVARARIFVDSRKQCVDHGEAGWAIREGSKAEDDLMELGELLAAPVAFAPDETVVVDLTGLGVQDLAIATSVWQSLA
jgi:ornithine cyclodeaminase